MSPLRTWVTAVLVTCSQPLSFLIHCMGFFSSNFHPSVQRVVCCKCCIGLPFQHTHHRTEMPKIYPSRSLPSDLEANGMDHHVRVLGPCMSWEEPGVTTEKPNWGHGKMFVTDYAVVLTEAMSHTPCTSWASTHDGESTTPKFTSSKITTKFWNLQRSFLICSTTGDE